MIIIVNRKIIIIIEKSVIVPLLSWPDFSELLFSQDTCLLLHMIDQCYMHMFHKTFIFKKNPHKGLY